MQIKFAMEPDGTFVSRTIRNFGGNAFDPSTMLISNELIVADVNCAEAEIALPVIARYSRRRRNNHIKEICHGASSSSAVRGRRGGEAHYACGGTAWNAAAAVEPTDQRH